MDIQLDRSKERCIDILMNRQIDRQMDGQLQGGQSFFEKKTYIKPYIFTKKRTNRTIFFHLAKQNRTIFEKNEHFLESPQIKYIYFSFCIINQYN